MNKFKIGTNFDIKLIDEVAKANAQNRNKVVEMYGSVRKDAELAARPYFRLPDISREELKEYVQYAKQNCINFNYTLNSINPMRSKYNFAANEKEIRRLIEWLTEIGVYRVTVANPMLLELMKNMDAHPQIEISTIAHTDTITQIRYYYETYGVTKICCNLNKNRDFKWLAKAAKYCNENNIELELMANEFCGVGGSNYATHCIYRDSCYICHSTNETVEDANSFNSYPMKQCTMSRNINPANWLKTKFIRPEDMHLYNDIGVYNFKLTGRTATTEYLLKVLAAYMSESWDGNLLGLWKPLESITKEKDESFATYDIPNKKLKNFLKFFVDGHNCDYEVCGQTCKYCEHFYKTVVKGE